MPKKIKKTLEEIVVHQYTQGEGDLRKLGKKNNINSKQVMEILEKAGII